MAETATTGALGPSRVMVIGTGSIAVCHLPTLVTALRMTWEIDTFVCLTAAAERLVSATALSYLSGRDVVTGDWPHHPEHGPEHIWLAGQVDLVVVWPATLDFMSRCAHGLASDVAAATVLSAPCPVVFAPAVSAQVAASTVFARTRQLLVESGHTVLETVAGRTLSSPEPQPGACVGLPRLLQACRTTYAEHVEVTPPTTHDTPEVTAR